MGAGAVTRLYVALFAGTVAVVLLAADHRMWAGVVLAACAGLVVGRARRGPVLSPTSATLDHIVPHSQGGSDDPSQLVTACWSCNRDKGNRTPEQWLAGVTVDTVARERAFIPTDVRLAVYARDGYRCRYCGVEVS